MSLGSVTERKGAWIGLNRTLSVAFGFNLNGRSAEMEL